MKTAVAEQRYIEFESASPREFTRWGGHSAGPTR